MKNTISIALCLTFLFVLIGGAAAVAADIAGSKDHPLVKRYEGSEIMKYDHKSYASYTIALAPSKSAKELRDKITVEGAVTRISYKAPMGRSSLEVLRNYENELKSQGFEVLFQGGTSDLGPGFSEAAGYRKIEFPPNIPAFYLNEDAQYYMVLKKSGAGDTYAVIFTVEQKFWASDLKGVEKGQTMAQVDVIETKPMEQKMVTVSADEMAQQIEAEGAVALYGIYFDTNKADIKPESDATLKEMAKFLKSNTTDGFLVVGHTDSVGSFESNMKLSQRRAEAVVKALAGKYGVDGKKLKPVGISFASPKATNRTEEGRAKNRRVELVVY